MKIIISLILLISGLVFLFYPFNKFDENKMNGTFISQVPPTFAPTPIPVPDKKILESDYHVFQTFNNCGPAALSMALKFYSIDVNQKILGDKLRPYQIPSGDNDDKSVTLAELSDEASNYNLKTFRRPMGNIEIIKKFISINIPVITRTWTKPDEDIGHFRIIKGFDENKKILIQDDSLQGKNLIYSYDDFNLLWKKFNYEYLVLVPTDKLALAEEILGNFQDPEFAWKKAAQNSLKELEQNPDDIYARFNLSVAYYNINEFEKSVQEFGKTEKSLPFRTLWYQLEPVLAYYEFRQYDKVWAITDEIINNGNRAYSELYILRGKILQNRGKTDEAKNEFEKAVFYNSNLREARELLDSMSD